MKKLLAIAGLAVSILSTQSEGASLLLSSQFSNLLAVDLGSGGSNTYLSSLPGDPEGMEINSGGDLMLAVTGSGGKVLRINTSTSVITQTFSIGVNNLRGLSLQGGYAYLASPTTGAILRLDTNSGSVTEVVNSGLDFPYGVASSLDGTLYATELSSGEVSAINLATQTVTTVALGFSSPTDIVFSNSGEMYVAQNGNGTITRLSPGLDGVFGTLDDLRADLATGLSFLFGLELVTDQLYFTRGGTDKTISSMDLTTYEITKVADLPEVGRWITASSIPEPSSCLLGGIGFIAVLMRRRRNKNEGEQDESQQPPLAALSATSLAT